MTDGWKKKFKGDKCRGGAFIYNHPCAIDGRAIVENGYGFAFNGENFPSLADAKRAALLTLDNPNQTD